MPPNHLARRISDFDPKIPGRHFIQCIVGDTIRKVRIWSEEEWAEIDPAERPTPAEYFPGLGWIGVEQKRKPD